MTSHHFQTHAQAVGELILINLVCIKIAIESMIETYKFSILKSAGSEKFEKVISAYSNIYKS